jgi:hypothetical protein
MSEQEPGLVLGRYRGADLLALFAEAGVLEAIEGRGFSEFSFDIEGSGTALLHARLTASKEGARHALLDACLTELRLHGGGVDCASMRSAPGADLLVVYWLREQDPTAEFDPRRPRLPLQEHPGLGVLRRAFRVAVRLAVDLGKDGVAALPKFLHDAAIFYRSRLFLFLDPCEQGRFEALLRDLEALPFGERTLALVGDAVRDESGALVRWKPGLQVLPLTTRLADWFHSPEWQRACRKAFDQARFTWKEDALAEAKRVFEASR